MSYVINEEAKNSYINLDLLRKNFDSIDIDALQTIIYQTFKKYTYYLNDFALNLLLHLLIMIDRELNGKELDSGQTDFTFTSPQEEAFEQPEAADRTRFGIAFNDYEYFELYMLFRANANFSLNVSGTALKNAVGEDVLALTREYVRMIDNLYMIDLSANTFITPFALHLKNLIFRAKTGRSTKNPMTQAIKNNSPIVFDIAIYIALDLMDRYHFMVNEDETAFLAIHIGAEIERQSANIYKIPAILICPDYHDMASGILNTMMMNFGNQLNLIGYVTDETQCREKLREQELQSCSRQFR
ncbi:MAG: BglG family transcription antiterminator [Clostridium sp.]